LDRFFYLLLLRSRRRFFALSGLQEYFTTSKIPRQGERKMNKIGVLISVNKDSDFLKNFQTVKDNGFECCQLSNWDMSLYTDDCAKMINDAVSKTGVEISTLWAGWSGPREWNFTGGPMTLGIVPPDFRMRRAEELIEAARFATKIGVKRVATHAGFLPENMNNS
jgi:sugar phosphate isomerase/epimerase